MLSTYQQRPNYVQSWPPHLVYPATSSGGSDSQLPMQYMFQGYNRPTQPGHPSQMQSPLNVVPHLDHVALGLLQRSGPVHSANRNPIDPTHSVAPSSGRLSQPSQSFGRDGSTSGSGDTGYVVGSQRSATKPQHYPPHMNMQSSELSYYMPADGSWPGWVGASPPVSFPFAMPSNGDRQVISRPISEQENSQALRAASNTVENIEVRYQESKKTIQRRAQRERKSLFKAKSQQWPMKIKCTPAGEILKPNRLFVHAQFRATARRFLNLSIVHFRDHPDSDMQILHDDLNRRFVFDPPLRDGYVLFYIENSLRTTRYIWRKFWVTTGRGEKHRFCPAKFFPALVKYWRTAEAEEESRKLKAERDAAKKQKEERIARGEATSQDDEDAWDVSTLDRATSIYALFTLQIRTNHGMFVF